MEVQIKEIKRVFDITETLQANVGNKSWKQNNVGNKRWKSVKFSLGTTFLTAIHSSRQKQLQGKYFICVHGFRGSQFGSLW